MTMTTAERITKLEEMAANGVSSAEVNGEKLNFRSLDEIYRVIARLKRELQGDLPRHSYPAFRRY